ncbi:MAG: Fic, partial [Pseudomonadota bacterium]
APVQTTLQKRILRAFVARGLLENCDAKDMLGYKHSGFSVDAGVCIEAHDRAALERLLRYCARPPFSMERLCPLTFLDVPEQAYSRATLGVYEMTRVELLRDLYVWAYERSTQEYLAIKQDLAEPDPLRLAWRDFIKQTILDVITQPTLDPLICIQSAVEQQVPKSEQAGVLALIVEELRRLHEGVLARYGLRPSQYSAWKAVHGH